MELLKRQPVAFIFTDQQKKWFDSNCCPICGVHRDLWKRRKDWRCCSCDCTEKFNDQVVHVWANFRFKVFTRDQYKCLKCSYVAPFELSYDRKKYDVRFLAADHIVPIAIGGEEYNLKNLQTLCVDCHKIKTREDMKAIAIFRRKHKEQRNL